MLQEVDSGKKDSCASQKAGDLNCFLGDRDRNLGSGFGVHGRGDRGGISVGGGGFLENVSREDRSGRRQNCRSGKRRQQESRFLKNDRPYHGDGDRGR